MIELESITPEDVIRALEEFSKSGNHDWEDNPKYRYAIEYQGKQYPPKKILSLITKRPVSDFYGGEETNKVFRRLGFVVKEKNIQAETGQGDTMSFFSQLERFLMQSTTNDLRTSNYVEEYLGCEVRVSFGVGNSSRIPWIAFLREGQKVQAGIYPVYLFYKSQNKLILAYGVSETTSPLQNWDNIGEKETIENFFRDKLKTIPERYGNSFVYNVYDVTKKDSWDRNQIETDLERLISEYKQMQFAPNPDPSESFNRYIVKRGYVFSEWQINNYINSLVSKPFVILTGTSGTGKTKIAQLFAEYLRPKERIQVAELPDNDRENVYYEVGLSTLKYGITIPVEVSSYFNPPERGESKEIRVAFGGKVSNQYYVAVNYTDASKKTTVQIRFRKDLKEYINKNFKVGDYLHLKKLNEDELRLEKYNPQAKSTVEDTYKGHVIIPVGADWTDKRHLLGFYNVITQKYHRTPALDLILEASKPANKDKPHFLILDEMNLSHVERYFADFLSSMESGSPIPLHTQEDLEDDVPMSIVLPKNLYVIGTVNVDETTYMFSPKVLDRANVLEFEPIPAKDYLSGVEQRSAFKEYKFTLDYSIRDKKPGELLEAMRSVRINDARTGSFVEKLKHEIDTFQSILSLSGFGFGFRVIDEIVRYMYLAWKQEGAEERWDNWSSAFDAQILQKMLPKIHGSHKTLGDILRCLYCCCFSGKNAEQVQMLKQGEFVPGLWERNGSGARYKRSAQKLRSMQHALEKQHFVSFTK